MTVSFVIPFHNEERNVVAMVERVVRYAKQKQWTFEVVPVDDCSRDKTGFHLRRLASTYPMVHPVFRKQDGGEKGNTMGKALREGMKKIRGDIVIWTMGDLADDPETYGKIVDEIRHGYDLVFGSRYMPGGSRGNLDPTKAFLSSWGTRVARVLFGMEVHDITNAFRGFRRSVFESLPIASDGFAISPEFAILAHICGRYKIGQVPTVYTNRAEGVSNFKIYSMSTHYLSLYLSLFYRYKILRKTLIGRPI